MGRKKRGSREIGEDDPRPGREARRRDRRQAGVRSAEAAHALIDLPPAAFARLEFDPELREEIEGARTITSNVARRREERRLAGILRGHELEAVEKALSDVEGQAGKDALHFKQAEGWRADLLDETRGSTEAAVARFLAKVGSSEVSGTKVGGIEEAALTQLVTQARHQAITGRKGGAAKDLFRQLIAALRAQDRRPDHPRPHEVP
ncbi:MAG: DUF615 domain-containing protein [Deltaproteobacteria bacterium]|nr:DUF615 domain-containing protein [Deltaproteobacteria bacterium]